MYFWALLISGRSVLQETTWEHLNRTKKLTGSRQCLILIESAMFWCNFSPRYTCWTTVIFLTLKDGSPQVNSLAFNNCFSYRNCFQNGVNALWKKKWVLINPFFFQKISKFCLFWIIGFCSNFTSMWSNRYQIMCEETLDFQYYQHLQRQHERVVTANLLQNWISQSGILYLPFLMLTLEV